MLRIMFGKCVRITGCIVLVAMAIIVIVTMGPTKTEYDAIAHLTDSAKVKKYAQSNTAAISTKSTAILSTTSQTSFFRNNMEFHQLRSKDELFKKDLYKLKQQQQQQEVRHIGFVKVHKAASSTMQNIFFRFGLKRNLTFVFTTHPNYFSRSFDRHLPLVKPRYRKGYDILCNHGVFNYDLYSSLLPDDTVYLAIVRDPLSVFISAVNYYSQKSQKIDYIARIPGNRIQKLIQKPEVYDRDFFSYTKNVMARDFGFPKTTDQNRIEAKLKELGQTLKLVLLVEHFEESLILMKRYLNWKLKDILFLSNNVYGKGQTEADLTLTDKKKFKERNKLDYMLHDFFYKKFWDQYNSEADDIKAEVSHFKSVLSDLNSFCQNKSRVADGSNLTIHESKWTEQFSVTVEDCKYMEKDELKFITLLRQKQGSELRG